MRQDLLPSIIHLSASADTTSFVYTQVYAGSGTTIEINGVSVVMAAGSTLNIKVKSIGADANVSVLGNPIVVYAIDPNINPIP